MEYSIHGHYNFIKLIKTGSHQGYYTLESFLVTFTYVHSCLEIVISFIYIYLPI